MYHNCDYWLLKSYRFLKKTSGVANSKSDDLLNLTATYIQWRYVYLIVNDRETFIRNRKKSGIYLLNLKSSVWWKWRSSLSLLMAFMWHVWCFVSLYFSIHGHIVIPAVAVAIIDTPQFQRLRFLKQVWWAIMTHN